ncbi:DUF4190 domain-containing protein [Microbacterium trichothecenolyticum]|uniref:Septum formation-related domain-containing protein n=1 Tax=Microbacterium trichothecenolyticum TaxID=69370 RepID=A0ABU0TVV9_MICTR|nr:DUF4190 domain-containing protein [Microbacterium trichothecenolyticum]MDQ1123798.1 hypothetical protein [Microbacterium trichothecenolyticum]
MAETTRLLLSVPPAHARRAVAATLSEQGFVVRDDGGVLEVSRPSEQAASSTTAAPACFRVRFAAAASGAVADFEREESASSVNAVFTAATRVARMRLAERGLIHESEHTSSGEDEPRERDAVAADPPVPTAEGDAPADPASHRAVEVAPASTKRPIGAIAVVALILGFAAPLGGIVVGAMALVLLRRTREGGRGLAIAGIVVGAVMTVLVGAVVAVGLGLALRASPPPAAPNPSASSPVDGIAPSPSATEPTFVLQIGQCFSKRGRGEIGDANLVDCADAHSYEIYAQFPLEDASSSSPAPSHGYPGDEAVAREADAGCVEAFAPFVGRGYEHSAFDYVYVSPTQKSWARGDRLVTCLVTDPAATTVGSLRDAGR